MIGSGLHKASMAPLRRASTTAAEEPTSTNTTSSGNSPFCISHWQDSQWVLESSEVTPNRAPLIAMIERISSREATPRLSCGVRPIWTKAW